MRWQRCPGSRCHESPEPTSSQQTAVPQQFPACQGGRHEHACPTGAHAPCRAPTPLPGGPGSHKGTLLVPAHTQARAMLLARYSSAAERAPPLWGGLCLQHSWAVGEAVPAVQFTPGEPLSPRHALCPPPLPAHPGLASASAAAMPCAPALPSAPAAQGRVSLGPSRGSPAAAPVPGSTCPQPCPPLTPFSRQTPTHPQGKERDLPCQRRRRTLPSCWQHQARLALSGQPCSHFLRACRASLPALGLFPSRPSPVASPHPAPCPRLSRRGAVPPPGTPLPSPEPEGNSGVSPGHGPGGTQLSTCPMARELGASPRCHGSQPAMTRPARAPQEVRKGPAPAPGHRDLSNPPCPRRSAHTGSWRTEEGRGVMSSHAG